MNPAYCTAVEADVYLASYSDWLALATADKDLHLAWGRVYIDSEYSCIVSSTGEDYDDTNATDEMKHANAFLGYLSFTSKLFGDVPTVESASVAAGSVSSTKTYQGGFRDIDQMFKQAELLLKTVCTSSISNNSVSLSRV